MSGMSGEENNGRYEGEKSPTVTKLTSLLKVQASRACWQRNLLEKAPSAKRVRRKCNVVGFGAQRGNFDLERNRACVVAFFTER